jgi:ATP-dependent Clp protease ATP-binding subunit ClpA
MTTRMPTRSKSQIEADLAAANAAKAQLPELQRRVEQEDAAKAELQRWNSQNRWPERQAEAMESAKNHIQKARTAEIALKRYVGQIAESPAWRAAVALSTINSERIAAQQALQDFVRVDYEKTSKAAQESGAADTAIAAKGHVAEVASKTRIAELLGSLDPDFDICRSIPVDQRQIIAVLRMLLWPATMLTRAPLDSSR